MFWWSLSTKAGPAAVEVRSAVAVGSDVYFCTAPGIDDPMEVEVHVFNTVSCLWTKLCPAMDGRCPPRGLCGHTAVGIETTIYIWGGQYYDTCGRQWSTSRVLYAFDIAHHRWSQPIVSGTVPWGTYEHSACVLSNVMYVYGGIDGNGLRTADVHKLDTSTMVWSLINTEGDVSEYSSATMIGTNMFVFGGRWDRSTYYGRIRVFDTGTGSWLSTASELPLEESCWGHTAFAYDGELYIICGYSYTPQSSRLWKLNPETLSWKEVKLRTKGSSRINKLGCCVVGDRVIVFHSEPNGEMYMLYLSPSLKTLCELAVIRDGTDCSTLPYNVRQELTAMAPERKKRSVIWKTLWSF